MKTEAEIRELIDILRNFNPGNVHDGEIIALTWVLNEHKPMPQQSDAPPRTEAGFQVRQSPYPGGFAVRGVNPPKKEEA